jgi:hypothetical protein
MLKQLFVPTALALMLGTTGAMADTVTQFNITEPFGGPFAFIEGYGNPDNAPEVDVGGSLTIDVTSGQIISSAVTATHVADGTPSTFSTIHSVASDSTNTGTDVTVWDAFNLDAIVLDISTHSFVGYAGGGISGSFDSDTIVYNGSYDKPFVSIGAAQLAPGPSISTTPLPAALPLFGAGLGFFGSLVRRRKRKAGTIDA